MKEKPGLMIAVLDGLKKKGKMSSKSMPKDMDDEYSDAEAYREQLEMVSKELIQAVKDEDEMAVADLLEEAFMCLDGAPHKEGPHLEEDLED